MTPNMVIDPGDWLPLAGLSMIAACTALGVAGAWALGRARGVRDAMQLREDEMDTRARIERMERSLQAVAEEIERLGEVQRFALKVISDKVSEATAPEHMLPPGRVITPH